MKWTTFVEYVRSRVHILATENHLQDLICQLQLMGEVNILVVLLIKHSKLHSSARLHVRKKAIVTSRTYIDCIGLIDLLQLAINLWVTPTT